MEYSTISQDISLEMLQDLGEDGLKWRISTSSIFQCQDAEIITSIENYQDLQTINLEGISLDHCPSDSGLLIADVPFEEYQNQQDFQIRIKNSITVDGSFSVGADAVTISLQENDAVYLDSEEVKFVDESLIWFGANFENGEQKVQFDDFVTTLTQYSFPQNLQEGNYGYFIYSDNVPTMKYDPQSFYDRTALFDVNQLVESIDHPLILKLLQYAESNNFSTLHIMSGTGFEIKI